MSKMLFELNVRSIGNDTVGNSKASLRRSKCESGMSLVWTFGVLALIGGMAAVLMQVAHTWRLKALADYAASNISIAGSFNAPHYDESYPSTLDKDKYQPFQTMGAIASMFIDPTLINLGATAKCNNTGQPVCFQVQKGSSDSRVSAELGVTQGVIGGGLSKFMDVLSVRGSSEITNGGLAVVLAFDQSFSFNFGGGISTHLKTFGISSDPISNKLVAPDDIKDPQTQKKLILIDPANHFNDDGQHNGWSEPAYNPSQAHSGTGPVGDLSSGTCGGESICGYSVPVGELSLLTKSDTSYFTNAKRIETAALAAVAPFTRQQWVYTYAGRTPEEEINNFEPKLTNEVWSPYQPQFSDFQLSVMNLWNPDISGTNMTGPEKDKVGDPIYGVLSDTVVNDVRYPAIWNGGRGFAAMKAALYGEIFDPSGAKIYDGDTDSEADSYAIFRQPALTHQAYKLLQISGRKAIDFGIWTGEFGSYFDTKNPSYLAKGCKSVCNDGTVYAECSKAGKLSMGPKIGPGVGSDGLGSAHPSKVLFDSFFDPGFNASSNYLIRLNSDTSVGGPEIYCSNFDDGDDDGTIGNSAPAWESNGAFPFARLSFNGGAAPQVPSVVSGLLMQQYARPGTRSDYMTQVANNIATQVNQTGARTIYINFTDGLPDDAFGPDPSNGVAPDSADELMDNLALEVGKLKDNNAEMITWFLNTQNKVKSFVTGIYNGISALPGANFDAKLTKFAQIATQVLLGVPPTNPEFPHLVIAWKNAWNEMYKWIDSNPGDGGLITDAVLKPNTGLLNPGWFKRIQLSWLVLAYNSVVQEAINFEVQKQEFSDIVTSDEHTLVQTQLGDGATSTPTDLVALRRSLEVVIAAMLQKINYQVVY